jgi:hypothetical protein
VSSLQVYKQWSPAENGVNRWGGNVEPISLIGNNSWSIITAGVSVKLGQPGAPTTPPPTPPPTPAGNYANWQNQYNGLCLDVRGKLTADGSTVRSCWSTNVLLILTCLMHVILIIAR